MHPSGAKKIDEYSEKRDNQEENGLRGKEKDSAGAKKRKGSRSDSSKHLQQYKEEWEVVFP